VIATGTNDYNMASTNTSAVIDLNTMGRDAAQLSQDLMR
jgi:hypothetical protein